ncbi:tetratricopeptide repeat protein [Nitratireductor basaltis]|uniref:Tetratricopeptide TPR_2 n=1 Tax=Nitratireductor basaltis TaxID=472175 RepID=A0A084UCV4_9HYPH|nr:tetratricopeptide repeat protein [Nitratireductor basaltis]KFB10790.1 Tetratricopeptide TPR_2 precursor [Nitratireductor basaltis]
MRLKYAGLKVGAALGALLLGVGSGALAQDAEKPSFEPGIVDESRITIQSFSGAFLAARAAELDDNLDKAIEFYKRALAFQPDNTTLQQSLLLALVADGRMEEAIPYADKLKSEPQVERFSRLLLAADTLKDGDYAAAERWLKLVVESDLDRLITGTMTAWTKLGQGDSAAAITELEKLDGPDWYPLFTTYHRALIEAQAGNVKEADAAFNRVFNELTPRSVAPYTLGRIAESYARYLISQDRRDEALEVLKKAEENGGGVASVGLLRERIEAGEEVTVAIPNAAAGAAEILLNVATELAVGGGESFVRLYLNIARAAYPDNDAAIVQLAQVAERQGQSQKAIDIYGNIGSDSLWSRFASFQIGLNLSDLGKKEEAVSHLNDVLEQDPSDMRAYLALGGVYASDKNFEAASELYDRAVEQIETPERQHWAIYYQRGIAYERIKQWEKAEPNFRQALELYPDHPQVLNYLGYSWVDRGENLTEAMDLIRRAVELRPSDGYIVDSLGWAHYKLGEFDEAVEHLERAVSLRPDDAVLNDHLGDAYWKVGRKLEARYQWSHALTMEPESELKAEVERKLEEGLEADEPKKEANAAGALGAGETATDAASGEVQSAPMSEAPEVEVETIHVVQPGETLHSIATKLLGDGKRFRELLELNPVLKGNPDRLTVGQELKLPAEAE